jgi:hypothetical protein
MRVFVSSAESLSAELVEARKTVLRAIDEVLNSGSLWEVVSEAWRLSLRELSTSGPWANIWRAAAEGGSAESQRAVLHRPDVLRAGCGGVLRRVHQRACPVSIRTAELARNYLVALLRLIDGILAAMYLVLVVVLAALMQQPLILTFLLILLAIARHYGHRGEPDGWVLPASALTPHKRWERPGRAVT